MTAYLAKHAIDVYVQDVAGLIAARASDSAFNPVQFTASYFSSRLLLFLSLLLFYAIV